jgi:hypothetical protein
MKMRNVRHRTLNFCWSIGLSGQILIREPLGLVLLLAGICLIVVSRGEEEIDASQHDHTNGLSLSCHVEEDDVYSYENTVLLFSSLNFERAVLTHLWSPGNQRQWPLCRILDRIHNGGSLHLASYPRNRL